MVQELVDFAGRLCLTLGLGIQDVFSLQMTGAAGHPTLEGGSGAGSGRWRQKRAL